LKKVEDMDGVEVKFNTSVGNDIPYEQLKSEYDAIFVGIGAHQGWTLGVDGEDAPNVYTGTDFLHKLNSGEKIELGDSVYVIGGGDTAIDAARVSRRLGVKEVVILYRRTQKEMPAIDQEIEEALEEDIKIEFLAAPVAINVENGKAVGMKCIKMELGEPDASGRRRPVPIEGSEHDIKCSTIVAAISQGPELKGFETIVGERGKVKGDVWGKSEKDEKAYVGGDVVGLSIVTTAIAHGRKAAEDLDRHFNGKERPTAAPNLVLNIEKMKLDFYDAKDRQNQKVLPVAERYQAFDTEVNLGFTEEQVKAEAARCMSCGSCFDCERCWMYCQDSAVAKPATFGEPYTYKLDLCTGCKKCAEECPCGFLEMA